MKTRLFIIALICFNFINSQNFSELDNYEFKTVESYTTEQGKVLEAANYLFENPASRALELNRLISIQYIMKWMQGTPDYTFEIGNSALELTKGNSDLLGLYLAAMTKTVLENDDKKLNDETIYRNAEQILVDYCADSKNLTKPSKKIKKLLRKRKDR